MQITSILSSARVAITSKLSALYNCRLFIFLINYFFSVEGDDKEDTNFLYGAVAKYVLCGPPLNQRSYLGFLFYLMTIPIESIRLFFILSHAKLNVLSLHTSSIQIIASWSISLIVG